jgi:hypothetical protein
VVSWAICYSADGKESRRTRGCGAAEDLAGAGTGEAEEARAEELALEGAADLDGLGPPLDLGAVELALERGGAREAEAEEEDRGGRELALDRGAAEEAGLGVGEAEDGAGALEGCWFPLPRDT